MSNIEEVPIAEETAVPDGEADEPPPAQPAEEEPAPKKRGRPKGALNKKTVAKKTATKKTAPVEEEPPPVRASASERPARKRKRAATPEEEESSPDSVYPQPPDTRAIAAEVIQMLSNRHLDRAQARREKYRSWFQ